MVADSGGVGGEALAVFRREEFSAFLEEADDASGVEALRRAGVEAGFGAEFLGEGGFEGLAGEGFS